MQNAAVNISNMRVLQVDKNPFSRLTSDCQHHTERFIVGLPHTEGKHTWTGSMTGIPYYCCLQLQSISLSSFLIIVQCAS